MTIEQVCNLQRGDKVRWNDPDQGICSRTIKISNIRVDVPVYDDSIVYLYGEDGTYLECYAHELT